MIIVTPEVIEEKQMRQIVGARGFLSIVLGGEERRYRLFSNKMRKEYILLAKENDEILGYVMWQEGWRTPFSANIIDFLKVHGASGLWKYVFFTYTEWRGSVFELYIYSLKTFPEHRRRGVAKQLMREMELLAKNKGYTRITCEIWAENQKSFNLFRVLGYKMVRIRKIGIIGRIFGFKDLYLMQRCF